MAHKFDNNILATNQTLTATYTDLGEEIDVSAYNYIRLHLDIDINDSEGLEIKTLFRNASSITQFQESNVVSNTNSDIVNQKTYKVRQNIDQKIPFEVNVTGINFIQFQVQVATVGPTAGQIDEAIVDRGDGNIFKVQEPNDVFLEIAKGNIEGHTQFDKFGRNPDIDSGSAPEDIWNGGGDYTGFPTGAAETMEILSDDSSDTAGGTGARTVKITNLLDGDGKTMPDVEVTLNGTTPVSLGAETYSRATRVKVLTAGSSGFNEGELTLRHTTTTANIFAVMPEERNQTVIACYTVPVGQTLYVKRITMQMARANGSLGSANMTFRNRPFGGVFNTSVSPEITSSLQYSFENNGYFIYPERTDIKVRCESVSDNNTIVTADFSGFLVDD